GRLSELVGPISACNNEGDLGLHDARQVGGEVVLARRLLRAGPRPGRGGEASADRGPAPPRGPPARACAAAWRAHRRAAQRDRTLAQTCFTWRRVSSGAPLLSTTC